MSVCRVSCGVLRGVVCCVLRVDNRLPPRVDTNHPKHLPVHTITIHDTHAHGSLVVSASLLTPHPSHDGISVPVWFSVFQCSPHGASQAMMIAIKIKTTRDGIMQPTSAATTYDTSALRNNVSLALKVVIFDF